MAIAHALVNFPPVLSAEEPTGNLDSLTGKSIIKLLTNLNERYQATMVVATHDKTIISAFHRVIELKDGQVVN